MSLSKEQSEIFTNIIEKEKGCCLLKGYAGTGKTFLAKEIIEYFLSINKSVTCLAPTHQAKLQLRSNFKQKNNLKFGTVASFFNVKLKKNSISGKKEFTDGDVDFSKKTDVIIVDECSMLTEKQVEKFLKLRYKSLIIFIGDFNQLPPINTVNGEKYFSKMNTYELTTQFRNSGEILKLCDNLRHKVLYPTESIENIVVTNNEDELFESIKNEIKNNEDPYKTSYLGFTNKSVNNMRNKIHRHLFNDDEFHVGQYLRLETPTTNGTIGEIYIITELKKQKLTLFNNIQLDGYSLTIVNLLTEKSEFITCLNYLDQDDIEECLKELYVEAEAKYNIMNKEKNKDLKNMLKIDWQKTLDMIRTTDSLTFVSSPYALTIHKSQGRTIDNVFLDIPDIRRYGGTNKKKLLYVGVSRAKERLVTIK